MTTDPCPWDRIADLEKKATPGEWFVDSDDSPHGNDRIRVLVDDPRPFAKPGAFFLVASMGFERRATPRHLNWRIPPEQAEANADLIATLKAALPSMRRDRAALLEVAKAAARVADAKPSTREYLDAIGELRVAVRSAREAGAIVSLGAPEPPTRARIAA